MVEVRLTEDARDDLYDLDGISKILVIKALTKLRGEPEQLGSPLGTKAGSNLTTFRKLVISAGEHCIVYRVEPDGSVVVVWVIGHRSDDEVYGLAVARLMGDPSDAAREFADVLEEIWRP
jgi:mRNA interferase RelE/StbE